MCEFYILACAICFIVNKKVTYSLTYNDILLNVNPFQHREEMRGRDDCQLDDNEKKKYDYE